MIRSYFGIANTPFGMEKHSLLPHQAAEMEVLKVHASMGGLCLIMGIPGTGKTVLKTALQELSGKRMLVATISRTLHTYVNTVKILCEAFKVDYCSSSFKCEKKLIEEAHSLRKQGKSLVTIIDDAHLMEMDTLRRLRLMFEDFPKNNNLILIGQPMLLNKLSLSVNEDIKSRVTYSRIFKPLNPDTVREFIFSQLDQVKLQHNVFTEDALELIIRMSEGLLRRTRNLCLSCLLEAVRNKTKTVDLKIVNKVIIQPHWRKEEDISYV